MTQGACPDGYDASRSDIWSCGVVLYALLCSHLPFDADDMQTLVRLIQKGQPTAPARVPPSPVARMPPASRRRLAPPRVGRSCQLSSGLQTGARGVPGRRQAARWPPPLVLPFTAGAQEARRARGGVGGGDDGVGAVHPPLRRRGATARVYAAASEPSRPVPPRLERRCPCDQPKAVLQKGCSYATPPPPPPLTRGARATAFPSRARRGAGVVNDGSKPEIKEIKTAAAGLGAAIGAGDADEADEVPRPRRDSPAPALPAAPLRAALAAPACPLIAGGEDEARRTKARTVPLAPGPPLTLPERSTSCRPRRRRGASETTDFFKSMLAKERADDAAAAAAATAPAPAPADASDDRGSAPRQKGTHMTAADLEEIEAIKREKAEREKAQAGGA